MITPRASTEIAAEPSAVIAFIADPANAPRWMVALEESVPLTPGPIVAGSRFREVMRVGGRRVEMICEVTAHEPGRRYAWRSVSEGPTDYGGSFSAEAAAAGTRLTYEGWATTRGELAGHEEAWGRQAQREAEAELRRIKEALEGSSPAVADPPNASLAADATPATRALEVAGVPHRVVRTQRASSAEESAALQGVAPEQLIRTIVVRRGENDYVLVLVPAGRRFDWPRLRLLLGVNRLSLPDAEEAREATGYERGTITPFGAARPWPVVVDAALMDEPTVAIGGGAHGVNIHIAPADLVAVTGAQVAEVSVPEAAKAG